MEIRKHPYWCCFLLFLTIALLECILTESFVWAGFHGFGDPPMEYTWLGELAANIHLLLPCLTGFIIIVIFVWKLHRLRQPTRIYFQYTLTVLGGIGTGVFIFYLDAYTIRIIQQLVKIIIFFIEHSVWMEYPAP